MHGEGWADFYELLGVAPDATLDDIKAAYRREAKRWHPDALTDDDSRMQDLNQAYAVLSDPESRTAYDRTLASASRPPVPRIVPDTVEWALDAARGLSAVTVRLRNEGGPVTTIEPERTAGAFWRITDAIAIMDGDDLVDFVIEPTGADTLAPGVHRDSVALLLDGARAVLTLKLEVPARTTSGSRSAPHSSMRGGGAGTARPPSPGPAPKAASPGVTPSGKDSGATGGALLALCGAIALLAAPFGIMAIWAPIFNRNSDNLLVDLIGLAIGIGCLALLAAGIFAVGAALMSLVSALWSRS